ncbi:MAG: hypothetical protein IPK75_19970 [Acidobacteria bacterium]|nr:hypothetical protein [Acidobacteriota bacterium]
MKHPFGEGAARHRPIGGGAEYGTTGHGNYIDLMSAPGIGISKARGEVNNGLGGAGANNYGHGWAISNGSDPSVTVVANKNGNLGLPFTLRIPRYFTGGNSNGGADQGVTILDTTTGIVSQFFQFYRINDNNANAAGRRTYSLTGRDSAFPWPNGIRISSSASGIAQMAVNLFGFEINPADGPPIQHPMGLILGRFDAPTHAANQLAKVFIWPASSTDTLNANSNKGSIPYGRLFAIPPVSKGGPNFDSLSFINTPQRRRYAQALREYGLYVVDGGQDNSQRADQYLDGGVRTSIMTMNSQLKQYLRPVLNNNAGDATAGGGESIGGSPCAYNQPGITWRAS